MFQKQGKKLLSAALCVLSLCFSVQSPQAVGTSAAASILMEADSGRILYAQNSDQELGIASTTKIMTALLVMEAIDQGKLSLTDQLTASHTAMTTGLAEDGSTANIQDHLTVSLSIPLYSCVFSSFR